MKKILLLWLVSILIINAAIGQQITVPLDKSPMDESYCPDNYPLLKIQNKITEPLLARVIYSRPQRNGRIIFGELIEYGKLWRLGANEATEIEFFQKVTIGNAKIKKGRYTLYAIPDSGKWTIILNKDTDTWGSFKYDIKNDVARIVVPVQWQTEPAEVFTINFEKAKKGYNLQCYWDSIKISIPVSLSL